jgi:histidine triad (HIT) family protein
VSDCVFCRIIAGTEPAAIIREWPDAIAFVPLGPVVPDGGHVLVVPRRHVADAVEDPTITAATMARAAELAADHEASNILTSIGAAATQSVFHLHLHVIRRTAGDRLMVPWGTTGNPHDPHACTRSTTAEAEREELRALFVAETDRAEAAELQSHTDLDAMIECHRGMEQAQDAADGLRAELDAANARLAELGEARTEWGIDYGGLGAMDASKNETWVRNKASRYERPVKQRVVGQWLTAGPERSYADKINEPLAEATIAALRDELKSRNYARYRKSPDPDSRQQPAPTVE